MQKEYNKRKAIMNSIKEELYTVSKQILLKPGGMRMKILENEFLQTEKSEAYRYLDC